MVWRYDTPNERSFKAHGKEKAKRDHIEKNGPAR